MIEIPSTVIEENDAPFEITASMPDIHDAPIEDKAGPTKDKGDRMTDRDAPPRNKAEAIDEPASMTNGSDAVIEIDDEPPNVIGAPTRIRDEATEIG